MQFSLTPGTLPVLLLLVISLLLVLPRLKPLGADLMENATPAVRCWVVFVTTIALLLPGLNVLWAMRINSFYGPYR